MHGTTDGALLVLPEESSRELSALMDHGFRFVVVDPRKRMESPVRRSRPPLLGRRPGDRPPARARSSPHRRDHRPTRLAGDRRALAGLPGVARGRRRAPGSALVIESNFEIDGGLAAATELLSRAERPTAIFASTTSSPSRDAAARGLGLRVPDDVSIVGFDDTAEAQIVTPRLTTVRQPLAEIGRMSVSLLTRLLDGQRVEALHVELETTLILVIRLRLPARAGLS